MKRKLSWSPLLMRPSSRTWLVWYVTSVPTQQPRHLVGLVSCTVCPCPNTLSGVFRSAPDRRLRRGLEWECLGLQVENICKYRCLYPTMSVARVAVVHSCFRVFGGGWISRQWHTWTGDLENPMMPMVKNNVWRWTDIQVPSVLSNLMPAIELKVNTLWHYSDVWLLNRFMEWCKLWTG